MAQFINMYKVELNDGAAPVVPLKQMHYADIKANRIGAIVTLNKEPFPLTGTCSGTAILADGSTVPMTGTVSGNTAYIELASSCYSVEGQIQVFVKLTTGGVTTTLVAGVGTVRLTETDAVIDPGTIIPSVSALINAIEDAVESIPADYSGLLATIAPTFSADKIGGYAVGDYVWYSGNLYRFTAAHTGSWTGTDAVRTTVSEGLNSGAVRYDTDMNITAAQKATARHNILAAGQNDLAPLFSEAGNYTAGQYVYYNDVLHRFTADHPAGAWTGTDAAVAVLGNDVTDLKSAINGLEEIAVLSVKEEKSIEIEIKTGKYYNRYDGRLTAAENIQYTDKIQVKPGDTYVLNGQYGNAVCLIAAFSGSTFSSEHSVICTSKSVAVEHYVYTVPNGITEIGISSYGGTVLSIKKQISLAIEDAIRTGETAETQSLEVLAGSYFDRTSGAPVNDATTKRTRYFSVTEGEKYCISGQYGNSIALIVALDSTYAYMQSASVFDSSQTHNVTDYEYIVPSGVALIGVSGYSSQDIIVKKLVSKYAGQQAAENKTDIEFIVPAIEAGMIAKTLDLSIIAGSYYTKYGGGITTNANGHRYAKMDVAPGETYYISGKYGGDIALLAAYDASGSNVRAANIESTRTTDAVDVEYVVPDGVAKVGISGYISADLVVKKDTQIYAGERSLLNSARLDNVEGTKGYAQFVGDNRWKGKKIVWFGTSIPEGGWPGGSYPDIIGELLGCTVYNEAVGTSRVHFKYPITPTEDNPYQFGNGFAAASRTLTNTLVEQQWIIDNYQSSHWTPGTGQPSEMTEEIAERIKSYSYERKLDKYLTEETFPDLFVFDHGHNDAPHSLEEHDQWYEQYGTYNLYTFRGAMNFLLKRILDYNPRARIVMIGEYSGTEQSLIPAIQMEVAKDWNLPICKDWEMLGWSKTQMLSLYGHWQMSGSQYVWHVDDTPTDISVFNAWVPDTVHPHTDRTGKAINHMAYNIARWLVSNITMTDGI